MVSTYFFFCCFFINNYSNVVINIRGFEFFFLLNNSLFAQNVIIQNFPFLMKKIRILFILDLKVF